MTVKRRLLKITGIVFLVGSFAGYFAFSTFFFNPLEGAFEADLSALVPRTVDWYASKARIDRDIGEFPNLAVMSDLEDHEGWEVFAGSPEKRDLEAKYGIPEKLQQLRDFESQLYGFDPLGIFGGEDVAMAGYFESGEWAAYGRVNMIGKFGSEALRYPGLFGIEKNGIAVEIESNFVGLSGGQLAQPMYVSRLKNVVAVGTSRQLVEQVHDLNARASQDSFGTSARYSDYIVSNGLRETGEEVELYVDTRAMMDGMGLTGRWPDRESQDFWPAFSGRLFQLGSLNELIGMVSFENGFSAEMRGNLSSELITLEQSRLYRREGVSRDDVIEAGMLAEKDALAFMLLKTDITELLNQIYLALDEATRELFDDLMRSTGSYQDGQQLIEELKQLFSGKVAVVMRGPYPRKDDDPPTDGLEALSWAVVIWHDGSQETRDKFREYHELVHRHHDKFGLEDLTTGGHGVYEHTLNQAGGFRVWEFWSPLVTGTGHISAGHNGRVYVVSNHYALVGDVLSHVGSLGRAEELQRLGGRVDFKGLVRGGQGSSNFVFWADPKVVAAYYEKHAREWSRLEVRSRLDDREERAKLEAQVSRESFEGRPLVRLSPEEQATMNTMVDQAFDEMLARIESEQAPIFRAKTMRQAAYLKSFNAFLGMMRLDPKHLELSVRLLFPL